MLVDISLDYINKKLKNIRPKVYDIDYKSRANEEQYEAIMHEGSPLLVIAGAGSGKTTLLTLRVARLIEDGVLPERILLLTFTKKAAQEMLDRARNILDERCSRVSGGTFHSFCANILRRYGHHIDIKRNFSILDTNDSEDIIDLVRTELGFNKKGEFFPSKSDLQELFSMAINRCMSLFELIEKEFLPLIEFYPKIEQCYSEYVLFKKENNLLDYDDLLSKVCELMESDISIQKSIADRFEYINIDEYQDTNLLQLRFVTSLCINNPNLCVVGDDKQSIYRFRGAHVKNILNFHENFPNTTIIKLNKNYRSVQPILDLANSVINMATEKMDNPLVAVKEGNNKPILVNVRNNYIQAQFIAQKVLQLREAGESLNDMSILVRNAYISNELEVLFTKLKIPFVKVGGMQFLERSHVKDILAFLRILTNKSDFVAWIRVLSLNEGIGKGTAKKIATKVNKDDDYLALLSKQFSNKKYSKAIYDLYDLLAIVYNRSLNTQLTEIIKFYKPLMAKQLKYQDTLKSRQEDLESLLVIAKEYNDAETFLTDVSLNPVDKTEENGEKKDEQKEVVTISTIHSAKGLEWNSVFIMNCVEGVIPSAKDFTIEDIDEVIRVLYVAITRAKINLFLTNPAELSYFGKTTKTELTRFLQKNWQETINEDIIEPEITDLVDVWNVKQ